MVGTIQHISNVQGSKYPVADFDQFVTWVKQQSSYQLDIETNVVEKWNEYKLISIQFGSCTQERLQWFFQWSQLTGEQKLTIKEILQNKNQQKLAHNARFEYIVLRFHGIIIDNLFDTMLAEKVLRGGLETMEYSLAELTWKYMRLYMDKTEQTNFGDDIMTDSKILYGVTDVVYLDTIKKFQLQEAHTKELMNVFTLEMESLPAFSDITYEGMLLNQEKWRENITLAEPVVQEAYDQVNKWLTHPDFAFWSYDQGYISDEDKITINYNSVPQKMKCLKQVFPTLAGGSMPIVKKFLRDNGTSLTNEELNVLVCYMEKNFKELEKFMMKYHRDFLVAEGLMIPAGTSTINWNSRDQVLPMAQIVEPRLKDLSEESVNKTTHKMLRDRKDYIEALKLTTTYGESFIRKYVDSDGRVRTNFNQVASTGRVTSSNPNMQNIIVKESVGTRYRNAFVCDPGWVFVDSDFVSQELVIIAYISKDPVWMDAIEKGYDLHSLCAELVHKDKWKKAASEDCAYYKMEVDSFGNLVQQKQKCKCKQHKSLRDGIKSINFGLAYGMSEFKLAGDLNISVKEARALINEYFSTFPAIGRVLQFLGDFGLDNGYIQTLAPFYRKRWFPFWYENKNYIEPHRMGVRFNPTLGEIERASKNMPIQGSSADITKIAMVLIRGWIHDNGYVNNIKFQAQVHDQVTTICRQELAEMWKLKMDELMREAARVVIPTGILKAETQITEVWTK
jgi:DNA polymerase I-like protein with 3'-5' exonuclease and polymerase domains